MVPDEVGPTVHEGKKHFASSVSQPSQSHVVSDPFLPRRVDCSAKRRAPLEIKFGLCVVGDVVRFRVLTVELEEKGVEKRVQLGFVWSAVVGEVVVLIEAVRCHS